MEREKAAGFPPPSSGFPRPAQPGPSPSSRDLGRMPDLPPRNLRHRRAQSEILSLPEDIAFDGDLGVVGSGDGATASDDADDDLFMMFMDMDKLGTSGDSSGTRAIAGHPPAEDNRPRFRHQHSQSMDSSFKPEMLSPGPEDPSSSAETKKVMSAAKLADLAQIDPKRAKRIWANRQSAARSKERKTRYIAELERKVQTLQTEATTLSAQLTMLQRDTGVLTSENSELKLRLQTMEQQVHLQDALNDTLREEVQRLKLATGQAGVVNYGPGPPQPPYPSNQAMQPMMAAHHLQQLHIQPRPNQYHHQHPHPLHHQHPHQQRQLSPEVKVNTPAQGSSDVGSLGPK